MQVEELRHAQHDVPFLPGLPTGLDNGDSGNLLAVQATVPDVVVRLPLRLTDVRREVELRSSAGLDRHAAALVREYEVPRVELPGRGQALHAEALLAVAGQKRNRPGRPLGLDAARPPRGLRCHLHRTAQWYGPCEAT